MRHKVAFVVVALLITIPLASLGKAQLLYSFEGDTTQDWVPTLFTDEFSDPDAELSVVTGVGNTNGQRALKIVGRSGDYVRTAQVTLDQNRLEALNGAVTNDWNLEFDWTVVAAENPGAQRYWAQLAINNSAGWTQLDMFTANGYPEWDPNGPAVQTIRAVLPLSIFGSETPGATGAVLDGNSTFYDFHLAIGGGNEPGLTRTYYLDNFRLVDPSVGTPGDFNGDDLLTAADIDLLSTAVRSGADDLKYDLNRDNLVNDADRSVWIKELKKVWVGDADLNGVFDTSDFVTVFQVGEYEDGVAGNSTWSEGDWSGDAEFASSDFVAAFQDGGFEKGPRAAVLAVPEPSSLWLFGWSVLIWMRRRWCRYRWSSARSLSH